MIKNKTRFCFWGLVLLFLPCLQAQLIQIEPESQLLPEEENASLAKDPIFCSPGVSNKSRSKGLVLEYGLHGAYNTVAQNLASDANQSIRIRSIQDFTLKAKIPLVNKPTFKLLGGYEYSSENFDLSGIGQDQGDGIIQDLRTSLFKTNKFSLYASKAINDRYYAIFRVRASYSGDYDGWASFDGRYATVSGAGILGIKPDENTEWGVGITYSRGFDRNQIYPFLMYNRTFNDKWGIETILPVKIYGRYNVNKDMILLFGGEYSSRGYSIDMIAPQTQLTGMPVESTFRHAEAKFQVSLEKHLVSWLWLNVKAGYEIPFRSQFIDLQVPENSFRYQSGSRPFMKVGIFLSPTDHCKK